MEGKCNEEFVSVLMLWSTVCSIKGGCGVKGCISGAKGWWSGGRCVGLVVFEGDFIVVVCCESTDGEVNVTHVMVADNLTFHVFDAFFHTEEGCVEGRNV